VVLGLLRLRVVLLRLPVMLGPVMLVLLAAGCLQVKLGPVMLVLLLRLPVKLGPVMLVLLAAGCLQVILLLPPRLLASPQLLYCALPAAADRMSCQVLAAQRRPCA